MNLNSNFVPKKIKVILTFLFFISCLYNSNAQKKNREYHKCYFPNGTFLIGIASSFDVESKTPLINTRFYYNLKKNICFGPEYYFSNFESNTILQEFNFVVHYIFDIKGFGVYPVGGISYLSEKEPLENYKSFGGIMGTGLHKNHKKLTFFMEYTLGIYEKEQENIITTGIFFML